MTSSAAPAGAAGFTASSIVGVGAPAGTGSRLAAAETAGAAPPAPAARRPVWELAVAAARPCLPVDARALLSLALPGRRSSWAAFPPEGSGHGFVEATGGFTHGPGSARARGAGGPGGAWADEVVSAVVSLGLRFTEKDGEAELHRLSREAPERLRDVSVFRAVHRTLSDLRLSMPARRFVHALLDRTPMDDEAWA